MFLFILLLALTSQRQFDEFSAEISSIGQKIDIPSNKCMKIKISSNDKSLNLDFTEIKNVQDILISDVDFDPVCNYGNILEKCDKIGQKCEFLQINNAKQLLQQQVFDCLSKVYIYVQTFVGESSLTLKTTKNNRFCSKIDPCQKNTLCFNECVPGCQKMSCRANKAQFCVSDQIQQYTSLSLCETSTREKYTSVKDISFNDLCNDQKQKMKTAIQNSDPWMDLCILLILIFLVVFGYYRYKFITTGEPPFDASCCPSWIFPRKKGSRRKGPYNQQVTESNYYKNVELDLK